MTFINISPSAVVQPPIQKLSPPPVYHWSSILHLTFSLPHTSVRRWSFHHSCFELLNFWAIFPTTSLIWCMFYPKAQISSDNIKLNYPWWHNSYHITRICMGLGGQSPSGSIFFLMKMFARLIWLWQKTRDSYWEHMHLGIFLLMAHSQARIILSRRQEKCNNIEDMYWLLTEDIKQSFINSNMSHKLSAVNVCAFVRMAKILFCWC